MKFAIGLLLIVFSIFLIAGIFIFLNSKPDNLTQAEKEKAITEMLGRKANLSTANKKTGSMVYEGKFGQLTYPASAEIYEYKDPESKNNENIADSFSFDMQNPRIIFNYSAAKSLDSRLEDIPAVKLRQDKSRGYKEEVEKINGVSGLIYSKERSGEYMAEKSLFILTNGIIYTISITGSNAEDIDKLYDQIIKTFRFK